MKVVSESVGRATVYNYRFERGWAIFTVNDKTGEFQITSDWGNWSHRWNVDHLGSPTLTSFLSGTDAGYVADKLSYGRGGRQGVQELDIDKTRESLRKGVIELYLAADIEEEAQRLVNSFIEDVECNGADSAFASTGLHEYMADLHEYLEYSYKSDFLVLLKELLPFFLGELKAKLIAEPPYYAAWCPWCGWHGSSALCGGTLDEDCLCPVCHSDCDSLEG